MRPPRCVLLSTWLAAGGLACDEPVLVTPGPGNGEGRGDDSGAGGAKDDTGGEGEEEPIWGPGLAQGGVVACPSPGLRASMGPVWRLEEGDWAALPIGRDDFSYGSGLAVEDFNGDGWMDVIVLATSACLPMWGQPGAALVQGTPIPGCGGFGIAHADVDGDRDRDLLVANRSNGGDQLFINDGAGRFIDEALSRGVHDPALVTPSVAMSLHDIDGDRDLDLFISSHRNSSYGPVEEGGGPNRLLLNDGKGYFTDVSERFAMEDRIAHTFLAAWLDLDLDGIVELYVVNDFGSLYAGNRLYYSDGAGNFSAAPDSVGLNLVMDGMGLGLGDLNEDGLPDLALSDWGKFRLMLSTSAGTWYDGALSAGITVDNEVRVTSWGVEVGDIDNDTDLDILAAFGPTLYVELEQYAYNPTDQPDALWLQGEDGHFTEASAEWGLDDRGNARGVVLADLDQDGWLDVLKTHFIEGPPLASFSRCGEEAWLQVRLHGTPPNTDAVGARVVVEAGGRRLTRWITAGSTGMASGLPLLAHFGLGSHDTIDRLEVYWPDSGPPSVFTKVPTRQFLTVAQGATE